MRKKLGMLMIVAILALFIATGCGGGSTGGKEENVVNVLNWSEYLPENLIQQFEEETGIKVNYSTISSNEELLAKLNVGNATYDLAVPSTYFIEVLINEGKLEKINKENIPNLKNIDEKFLGWDFDPNDDYSVPYMWGTEVIAYNEDLVDIEIDEYKDLFDPSLKDSLVVLDDPRTMLGAMLEMLGYSTNSTSEEEIMKAGEELRKLMPNIKAFDSDSPKNLLVSGEVKAGIVYGAEAALAMRENPSIKAVIPKDFLSLWQDNFVIPKDAPNKENAEKFIDFILRPEISKEITMDYPYHNPNKAALELLPEDVRKELELSDEDYERGLHAVDVGQAIQYYDRAWSEVKQ
ncbi:spermidine/putrescine ABC transporter substrate-binding protein [Siminovitchia sp. FSL H7-0308]|uniref:Spermidine/putrescine-binding protein n=1 Tax=Siminovitchia thermophila TaxID=1245522 RepID=A0ABS2R7S3_9BACI|nr:spermidine/putrescine ABC transporter substrate-binding protein [Siminovitchia thermophila]MBM7715702.1 spermidine/putrescine-binding protein [Siminovitchia thermophila]